MRRHGDRLLARARRIAPDHAEDARQIALHAYEAIRDGELPRDLGASLMAIVAHEASAQRLLAPRIEALGERVSARSTADDVADRDQIRRTVEVTKGLPPLERAALVAHALEGRSHCEIASAHGTSEGSMAMAIHRARRQLRWAVPPTAIAG